MGRSPGPPGPGTHYSGNELTRKEVRDRVSKVTPEIAQVYEKALQKRRKHIPKQISKTLRDGETGMLLMREEERVKIQFPSEINVILIRPPVLSEIEKWQREHQR